ncbi:Do family serine endopeptidase [Desulfovibrio sp. OttesenSCG-928-F20]|nr:Do family serine endopeptidase [Desulfovibrio sp. OttesenSCG-928-M16]MDL2291155.1 Do family serine endopeptidase [Desulfovibrio sp. OttesenSCG-928-F20]
MQKKYTFPALAALCLTITLIGSTLAQAAAPVDFRDLVKAAIPAVVNISSERTEEIRSFNPFDMFRGHPDMDRFFGPFQDFYDRGAPRSRKTNSLGSGFIISPDGFIVTNNHVIEGADVVKVSISGNNKQEDSYNAEVIGTDQETDLALLKIKADNLPCLKFGDSNVLDVGEWVVAIGSPLGLDHTVTAGIVSAKGRNIQSGSYDDFLQTDASINRGNSGGPLLNMAGEVIGINTAIAQRAQGIGFAIPSSLAQRIISDLRDHKKVSRGWLGVTIQNVDKATAKALGLKDSRGALVNSVLEGQPAALAGIREGDVIIKINEQDIEDTEQLLRVVALLNPGSKALVTVMRDGKEEGLNLTVAERDRSQASAKDDKKNGSAADSMLGLQVRPISPDDVRRFGLNSNAGLLIVSVAPDSPAAGAGLQPGDVVLAVNRQSVNTEKELAAKLKDAAKQRGAALLQISRQGNIFFRAVELEQ